MESHGDEVLEACLTGNTDVIRIYLETGVPVDTFIEGTLPIIAASYGGHLEVVKCLLDAGAAVNLLDKCTSALISASSEGHTDTVKLLLTHGAKVNLQGRNGVTALAAASINGHSETVEILLDHGADMNVLCSKGVPILRAACKKGRTETVRILLEHGAEVDLLDGNGRSALFAASAAGHTETVGVLLDYGAEIDIQDANGTSPLLEACIMGHVETVNILLHYGAYPDVQDANGTSALIEACTLGSSEIVKALLENGVETQADDEVSPLGLAIMEGRTEIVRLLLDHLGAKNPGLSALLAARSTDETEIQKLFEERGFDLNPSALAKQAEQAEIQDKPKILPASKEVSHVLSASEASSSPVSKPLEKSSLEGVNLKAMKKKQGRIMEKLNEIHAIPTTPAEDENNDPILPTSGHTENLTWGNIYRELISLDIDWQNIGVLLDVPSAELNAISADYNRTRDCLREMIMEWLKMVDPLPTWEILVEAVELIDPETAINIHTKYCSS